MSSTTSRRRPRPAERLRRLVAAAFLLVAPAAPAAAWSTDECEVPDDLLRLDAPLTRTAQRLVPGGTLTIVAIGSSSTFGAGASDPKMAYPSRLKRMLAAEMPETRIRVMNRGVNGEVVADMLARWDRDVTALQPDLVIWQVGANAALRATALGDYEDRLREGIRRTRAIGADMILMDPQYAPKVLARPIYRLVLAATDRVARENGVGLFRRFQMMHHWVEGGVLTFPVLLDPDQIHLNDRGYACVAAALTDAIVQAARPLTD
ncbi:SGNH/GDSL hydrolase family protein [Stella sp.]|uniref:SGNH/GDSL hydrolase family protein n=1 Tax=Stella sp. TaxID=2912054 RepID=UPI0035B1F124